VTKEIEEAAETNILKLKLKNIHLETIDVNYKSAIANLDTKIQFEDLNVQVKTMDLGKQIIVLNTLELTKTNGQLTLIKSEQIAEETVQNTSSLPWNIHVEAISLTDFNFQFDNNNSIETDKGIDYNHLKLNDLNLKANSISIRDNSYNGM